MILIIISQLLGALCAIPLGFMLRVELTNAEGNSYMVPGVNLLYPKIMDEIGG